MSAPELHGRNERVALTNHATRRRGPATEGENGPMPTPPTPTQAGHGHAPSRDTARGTLRRILAALTASAALALTGTATAHAGEWVQVSCVNPNQTAAGSAGWSSFAANTGYGSTNSTQCGPGAGAFALLSSDAAAPVGAHQTLQYTPPPGSTLNGGLLDIGMYADGHGYDASATAVAYTPEYAYNGSNVFFQCAAGLDPCSALGDEYVGELNIPGGRGGNLYLEAGCGGNDGYSCDEGANGAWSQIELWWANLKLTNDATPTATNIAGTLLSADARETRELLLTANDPAGPGVYTVTVQADAQTLYNATPDSNDGQCASVGASAGALMFDASQPCKQTETIDLPIDTTPLHDGTHTLKVTVTDAAGNSAVVYDNTITTDNAPENTSAPTISDPPAPEAGQTLTAQPGEWTTPQGAGATTYTYQWQDCNTGGGECSTIPGALGASYTPTAADVGHTLRARASASDNDGTSSQESEPTALIAAAPTPTPATIPGPSLSSPAPAGGVLGTSASDIPLAIANGTPTSERVQIDLNGPARVTRSYTKRALTITGRLTSTTGAPIANATLDAIEQAAGSSTTRLIAHGKSTANGAFTIKVPDGPSRTLTIGYRAYSTDAGYAAQASVYETVGAGVKLRITPQHTSTTGTITLEGGVQGPLPKGGVLVELEVHYRGAWVPFRAPHTNPRGRFHLHYQFQGGEGRFPFRAEVFGGQAAFPYAGGASTTVDVRAD